MLRNPNCWALIDHFIIDALFQNIKFLNFLAMQYCDQGICQLGAKLRAEES